MDDMPRFRTVAAALVVLACLGATLQVGIWLTVEWIAHPGSTAAAGPHLQLVTDTEDLGRLSPGDSLAARFVVANTGKQPLVFREAVRGCCSEETPPLTMVQPGRTREIAVVVDPARLREGGQQHFRFLTNDPQRPEFWLTVRGSIAPRAERSVLVKRP
jgi:hypothetical protein